MRRVGICCVLSLLLIAAVGRAAPLGLSNGASTVGSKLRTARLLSTGSSARRPAVTARAKAGGHAVLFGNQTVQRTVGRIRAGRAIAFPFAVHRAGTVSAISIYVDAHNKAKKLIVALYSNRSANPIRRVASGTLSLPKAGSWNTVSVTRARVRRPSTYWIAVLGRGGTLYFRDHHNRTCHSETNRKSHLASLPRLWTTGTRLNTCPISAYATGNPTNTPTTFGTLAPPNQTPVNTGGTTTSGAVAPPGLSLPPAPETTLPAVNISAPAVTGQAVQGQTLTSSIGSWSGSPTSYAYQWQDCNSTGGSCTNISGATSSTYTLQGGDVGSTIRSVVTATNSGGSTSQASAPTGAVTSGAGGSCLTTCFYVDPNATGSGNGTSWANAWTSLGAVNWAQVGPGDYLYLSGGTASQTYAGQTLMVGASGTAGNPITIEPGVDAGHNGKVIFDYQGSCGTVGPCSNTQVAVQLGSHNYIKVEGLGRWQINNLYNTTVGGTGNAAYGVQGSGGNAGITVDQMSFSNDNNPIQLDNSTATTISNNTLSGDRGNAGIDVNNQISVSSFATVNDAIYGNYIQSIAETSNAAFGPDGIENGSGVDIYDNTFQYTPTTETTSQQHIDSVQNLGGYYNKIYDNRFIDRGNSNIYINEIPSGGSDHDDWIYNNVFQNDAQYGTSPRTIEIYGTEMTSISDIKIENNVFADGSGNYATLAVCYNAGNCNNATSGGNTIENNEFINDGSGVSGNPMLWVDATAGTGWTLSHNVYYYAQSGTGYVHWTDGNNYSASPSCSSMCVSSIDPAAKTILPTFASYSFQSTSNDFHLQGTDTVSAGAGLNLIADFTTDKDGVARPASGPWTIGPYEPSTSTTTSDNPTGPQVGAPTPGGVSCTQTLNPGANVGSALSSASPGSVVCLNSGGWSAITLNGVAPAAPGVTLAATPGQTVDVPGITVTGTTQNLTIEGFSITAQTTGGQPGIQVICTVNGGVNIEYNTIENQPKQNAIYADATGCGAGHAQTGISVNYNQIDHDGGGVQMDSGGGSETNVLIAHNVIGPAIDWQDTNSATDAQHYIELGGVNNATIDHNAFEGPVYTISAGLHNNVIHLFSGQSNITVTNNIMWHTQNQGNASVLMQDSPMDNITIENNLDVEDPTYNTASSNNWTDPIEIEAPHGFTMENNTIVNGGFGMQLGDSCSDCYASGQNMTAEHNIAAPQALVTGSGGNYGTWNCSSSCTAQDNVTADTTANTRLGGTNDVINWTANWTTTTWTPVNGPGYQPPPSGYYQPTGLSITGAGYQGQIGP